MQPEDVQFLNKHVRPFDLGLDIGAYDVNGSVKKIVKCGKEIIGIDLAKQKGSVDLICDAEFLPFKDKSFDAVFCYSIVEHSTNALKVFSEAIRVSKDQIYFSIPMQSFPFHAYPRDRWRIDSNNNQKYPCIFISTV
ncbi:MAG: methyltransferase domain-containing protein [Nitrososphaerales archaeon]